MGYNPNDERDMDYSSFNEVVEDIGEGGLMDTDLQSGGGGPLFLANSTHDTTDAVDFDDPQIAALPRVLLMGPRRGGKTSIQASHGGPPTSILPSPSHCH
jgi:hypothetical protein